MFNHYNPITKIYSVLELTLKKEHVKHHIPRFYHALSIRLSGNAVIVCNEKQFEIKQNGIFFMPKKHDYQRNSLEDERIICIHFNALENENFPESFAPSDPYVFISHFQKLFNIWRKKDDGYMFEAVSLLNRILKDISIQNESNKLSYEQLLLQPAINFIKENFQNPDFKISDLAKMCRISTTYFRTLFHNSFNIAPLDYINNLRLDYATELLSSKYYSIEEVADKCGIPNNKYFSVLYKKKRGVSPSKVSFENTK